MLIGPNRQEAATPLKFLEKLVCLQGMDINLDMLACAHNHSIEEEETRSSLNS